MPKDFMNDPKMNMFALKVIRRVGTGSLNLFRQSSGKTFPLDQWNAKHTSGDVSYV